MSKIIYLTPEGLKNLKDELEFLKFTEMPDITRRIGEARDKGDLSEKPGWVRLSIHPVMTNKEISYIINAIEEIVKNHKIWAEDYNYNPANNEFYHKTFNETINYKDWFSV